ncbi:unnamed protein product [Ectocarpus sp. 13 AM-2016]
MIVKVVQLLMLPIVSASLSCYRTHNGDRARSNYDWSPRSPPERDNKENIDRIRVFAQRFPRLLASRRCFVPDADVLVTPPQIQQHVPGTRGRASSPHVMDCSMLLPKLCGAGSC